MERIHRQGLYVAALLMSTLLVASWTLQAQQPPPIFAFRFSSPENECGKAVAVDSAGNIILAGFFQNTIDFDPGPGTLLLHGHSGQDMVLAKYNRLGKLIWAKNIGGTADVTPRGIALDADDDIFVAGDLGIGGGATGTADFDPGPGEANLTSSGGHNPFFAKYDSNGKYLWARALGSFPASPVDDSAWDLAVDAGGSVYIAGSLNGTFDLNASPDQTRLYSSFGGSDIFLLKYDRDGDLVWGFGFGGAGDDAGLSVALDEAGHVYLSGTFSNTVDFDPSPGISLLNSAGYTDIFIARYTTDGAFENAIRLGGSRIETMSPGSMRTDSGGNLFLAGQFNGSVEFDPGPGSRILTNNGTADIIFVAAYTGELSLRWAFSIDSRDGPEGANRIVIDNQEDVWVTGWFSGAADFDGGPGNRILNSKGRNGATDIFLAKYDKDGNYLWANGFGAQLGFADNFSFGAGVAVDPQNNAYLTGQFYGQVDFDTSQKSFLLTSAGRNDGFLVKYGVQGNLLPTLFFPRLQGDENRYTGIAVANWGAAPADIEFTAFDDDGNKTASPAGIVNPKTITIPGGSQIALLDAQVFNLPPGQPRNIWAKGQATSSQLTGFFLEGSTDFTFLDGAVAGTNSSTELFFTRGGVGPEIPGNGKYRNRIDVVNPNSVSAHLDLKLLDEFGKIKDLTNRALGPHGRISEELASLFPSSGQTNGRNYVRMTSSIGVVGYQSVEGSDSLFALPAQPSSTQTRLVSAQFASGQTGGISYFTNLNLINTSNQSRTVQLTLVDNNGAPVGTSVAVSMGPGEQYQRHGDIIFGLPDPATSALTQGSLIVMANGPGIIGDVVFGDPEAGKFLASLPLDMNPATNVVFSQVAQGNPEGGKPYFTGVAIYNPNSTEASITIDVFSETGTKTGTNTLSLPGGGRLSKTLPQLVPAVSSQVRGYIRVTSTMPIAAFELFGDQNLDFLAAVPPQPITP